MLLEPISASLPLYFALQHTLERLVVLFDGAHGVIDQRADSRQLGVGL